MTEPAYKNAQKIIEEKNVKKFVTPEQKRQRKIVLVVIAVIAVIAAAGYFLLVPREKSYTLTGWESAFVERGNLPKIIQSSGSVSIPEQITILSPEEGYTFRLLVETGEEVNEGALLAVIDVPELKDELYDLELSLEDNQKLLRKTQVQNEITNARQEREIDRLENDLEDEQAEREKLEKLVAINASRKSELEEQKNRIEELQEDIEEAEEQLAEDKRLQQLEVEMIALNIRQLSTNITRLEEDIAEAEIRSTMAGEVLDLDETLNVPGSLIGKNQELFTIANPQSAIVELEVDEEYSRNLKKDQQVSLDISGTTLAGSITSIGRIAQSSSDGLGATVLVKVKPERVTDAVISGATAVGEFEVGTLENILMLPRGPYLSTGSQRFLYKIEGNTALKVEATFGESENNFIEVVKGVSEGDKVITSGYQNFIEYKSITLKRGE